MSDQAQFKISITGDSSGIVAASGQARDGLKGIAADAKGAGEAGKQAGNEIAEGGEHGLVSHKALRQMVKGLKADFPELGHLAHMALHPVTLITFAAVSAFEIWHKRVEQLTESLGGIEMPDISDEKVGRVIKMADAWEQFNKALAETVKAHQGVSAESERAVKAIEAEAKQKEKLLAADKGVELAKLELRRASITDAEYQKEKLGIEDRYAAAGLKVAEATNQKMLGEKARHAANLEIDSQAKMREAAGIHVGSEEADKLTLASAEKAAKWAEEKLKEVKERQDWLSDYKGGAMDQFGALKFYTRYGGMSIEGAKAAEEANAASLEKSIAQYNRLLAAAPGRQEARKRREELQTEAGKEAGEARGIEAELRADEAAVRRGAAVDRRAAQSESLARSIQALAEGVKTLKDKSGEAGEQVERAGHAAPQLLNYLEEQRRLNASLAASIAAIQGQLATMQHP